MPGEYGGRMGGGGGDGGGGTCKKGARGGHVTWKDMKVRGTT